MPNDPQQQTPHAAERRGTWRLIDGELVQDHRTASQPRQPNTGSQR